MILALEYLHYNNILYRDLKPENIIVDHTGYLRLVDLGTVKLLNPREGKSRTFTVLGTAHYMAPEIMEGKGYSHAVDLWSLGVLLYEFMIGYLPYGEDLEDPYDIYVRIKSSQLKFPKFFYRVEYAHAKLLIE